MPLAESMFAGMDPSDFTYTDNCPTSLAPNTRCSVDVKFAPTSPGSRSPDLLVSANGGSTQRRFS
jgi:hypothetical protein